MVALPSNAESGPTSHPLKVARLVEADVHQNNETQDLHRWYTENDLLL